MFHSIFTAHKVKKQKKLNVCMSVERSRLFFVRFHGKTGETKLVMKLSTIPADILPFGLVIVSRWQPSV